MGLLDDFIREVIGAARATQDEQEQRSILNDRDALNAAAAEAADETGDAIESLVGELPEESQELILEGVNPERIEAGEDPREALQEAEGAATSQAITAIAAVVGLEAAGLGQLDNQELIVTELLSFVALEDVLGTEIEATFQEGVNPALKQQVHSEYRSKQADFKDFTEAAVRSKGFGTGPEPTEGDIPEGLQDLLPEEDLDYLPDPDTYGTIPEQTSLYELVGLEAREPEELIEEPVQYGLHVPRRAIEATTNLAGMPKLEKEVFKSIPDKTPKTENIIQEYIRLTEVNFRLREAVQNGGLSPGVARQIIQPELDDLITNAVPEDLLREEDRTAEEVAEEAGDELERNFQLLSSIPEDPPSVSQLQAYLEKGIIDTSAYIALYDRFGYRTAERDRSLREAVIDKGADAVVNQRRLGRIENDAEAFLQLALIGFDRQQSQALLSGTDPENVQEQEEASARAQAIESLSTVPNIGETRASQLFRAGVENIAQLAEEDQTTVGQATDLNAQQARDVIDAAQFIVQQGNRQQE
jgi:hypothetical protein